jgi:hypothetical protein
MNWSTICAGSACTAGIQLDPARSAGPAAQNACELCVRARLADGRGLDLGRARRASRADPVTVMVRVTVMNPRACVAGPNCRVGDILLNAPGAIIWGTGAL